MTTSKAAAWSTSRWAKRRLAGLRLLAPTWLARSAWSVKPKVASVVGL